MSHSHITNHPTNDPQSLPQPSRKPAPDHLIRPARADDLETINLMVRACVAGWSAPDQPVDASMADTRFAPEDLGRMQLSVFELEQTIVGMMALQTDHRGAARLRGLYVSPLFRLTGIGRALLTHAHEQAAAAGCERIEVHACNDADSYFERLGFTRLSMDGGETDCRTLWTVTNGVTNNSH